MADAAAAMSAATSAADCSCMDTCTQTRTPPWPCNTNIDSESESRCAVRRCSDLRMVVGVRVGVREVINLLGPVAQAKADVFMAMQGICLAL